jgi:hypothetical protein
VAEKVAGVMDGHQAVVVRDRPTKARSQSAPTIPGTPTPPISAEIGQAYEWFLQLPGVIVLAVLWVAGAVLLGSCALVLYMAGSVLW